ncbi:MAG: fibronectin type III domain-containing protein [Nitrospirae bacterium]|nr:fibronectin type III domain-containing protein [Nitrospirota bacterium]
MPAPQNVRSVIGENNVTLSWDLVAGARGYLVYHDTKSAARKGKGLSIGNSPADVGNVSRVLIDGLEPSLTYFFEVSATAPDGEGPASPEISVALGAITAAPEPPRNLQARTGNASVALSWEASAGAAEYRIYYGAKTGGPYEGKEAKEGASPVSITGALNARLTGLNNGQVYFFAVSALNSKSESERSGEVSATPLVDLSDKPPTPDVPAQPSQPDARSTCIVGSSKIGSCILG